MEICSGGPQSHSRQAALGRPRRFWTSTSQWTTVPCWADLQRGDRPGLPFFESRPWLNSAPVLSGALPDLRHGNGPSCWRSCKGLMDRAIYGAPMSISFGFFFFKLTSVAFSLETYKESFSDPAGPKASSKFWGGSEIPS